MARTHQICLIIASILALLTNTMPTPSSVQTDPQRNMAYANETELSPPSHIQLASHRPTIPPQYDALCSVTMPANDLQDELAFHECCADKDGQFARMNILLFMKVRCAMTGDQTADFLDCWHDSTGRRKDFLKCNPIKGRKNLH